jgi:hypothetical protein
MRITILFSFWLIIVYSGSAQNFSYKKTSEGIEVSENNKAVLFFQTKPKTVDGKYARAGYVHPLYDLRGNILTEDMPEDHPYHRGIFWAWHQIVVDGKNIADGWTSDNISFEPGKMQVAKSGKNIIISSHLVWKITDSGKASMNIINEISRINIYKAEEHYRVIDFNILLKPVVKDIKLGGSDDPKGYGGFCVRLKLPDDIQFISGDSAVEPKETAVLAEPWMDFKMDSAGVAVFGYRDDSGQHPWILRKSKSMQNVPFPGRTPVTVPSDGLKLNYRIVVHDEQLYAGDIQMLYAEYLKSTRLK